MIIEGVVQLAETLKQQGARRILDLGCGDGRHLIYLAKQGFIPIGVESSIWGLIRSQEWAGKEGLLTHIAYATVRHLPLADESVDSAISINVIHHQLMEGIRETLRDIKRVLRTKGLFYAIVPRYPPGDWKDGNYIEVEEHTFTPQVGFEKDLPHHLFTVEDLTSTLEGFEVLEIEEDPEKPMSVLARKRTETSNIVGV